MLGGAGFLPSTVPHISLESTALSLAELKEKTQEKVMVKRLYFVVNSLPCVMSFRVEIDGVEIVWNSIAGRNKKHEQLYIDIKCRTTIKAGSFEGTTSFS